MKKLNVGCNNVLLDGWDNLDILEIPEVIQYDARTPLPYEENSVDFIFSEHFIEHLTETNALFFLKECYRVLKPFGVIRTSTFDIDDIIEVCHQDNWERLKHTYLNGAFKDKERIEAFNLCIYEGNLHKFMYSPSSLIRIMKKGDFSKFSTPKKRVSSYTELQNLEWRDNSTCIVEAIK